MTKVVPSISVMTVVFPDGPPLSFTQVRSPLFPWSSFFASFIQPMLLARFHIRNGRLLIGIHWISSLSMESGWLARLRERGTHGMSFAVVKLPKLASGSQTYSVLTPNKTRGEGTPQDVVTTAVKVDSPSPLRKRRGTANT